MSFYTGAPSGISVDLIRNLGEWSGACHLDSPSRLNSSRWSSYNRSATGTILLYQALHSPVLSPPMRRIGIRRGSNANRIRTLLGKGRSSFIFACRELVIESKNGRPSVGPSLRRSTTAAPISSCESSSRSSNQSPNSSVYSDSHIRLYNANIISCMHYIAFFSLSSTAMAQLRPGAPKTAPPGQAPEPQR
jgi:hypothetical protein